MAGRMSSEFASLSIPVGSPWSDTDRNALEQKLGLWGSCVA